MKRQMSATVVQLEAFTASALVHPFGLTFGAN